MRCRETAAFAVAAILAAAAAAPAQEFKLGASLRNYNFYRLDNKAGDDSSRHDTEFAALRLVPVASFGEHVKFESNMVLEMTSPPGSPAAALVTGRSRTYLPLDYGRNPTAAIEMTGYFDRLNVRIHTSKADLVVGRQAITWGVNTLWPALDLFAPFTPTQIDRDYKAGVDAVRLTVPIESHSEFQVVGAALGDSPRRDGAGGALLRVSAGAADFGVMGGWFHRDVVAGGFMAVNIHGALLRGEASWTRAGDALDRLRRPKFWRGGLGLERQLSSSWNWMMEVARDGYGDTDVLGYPAILASDRMRRGEVRGLGRWYAGTVLTWKVHPLVTLTNTALVNCSDTSAVWIPVLAWSVASGFEIITGAQLAFGPPPGPAGVPGSEYGTYTNKVLAGFKLYL